MNLRILKKLSKRAAPLLPLLGDRREQFSAARDASYTGVLILDRKHWERGRSVHSDTCGAHEIKQPARDGRGWVYTRPPSHPRKGTMMVGGVAGYYEPEWSEETAWEALEDLLRWTFAKYDARLDDLVPTRSLALPSEVFAAAAELIAGGAQATGGEDVHR